MFEIALNRTTCSLTDFSLLTRIRHFTTELRAKINLDRGKTDEEIAQISNQSPIRRARAIRIAQVLVHCFLLAAAVFSLLVALRITSLYFVRAFKNSVVRLNTGTSLTKLEVQHEYFSIMCLLGCLILGLVSTLIYLVYAHRHFFEFAKFYSSVRFDSKIIDDLHRRSTTLNSLSKSMLDLSSETRQQGAGTKNLSDLSKRIAVQMAILHTFEDFVAKELQGGHLSYKFPEGIPEAMRINTLRRALIEAAKNFTEHLSAGKVFEESGNFRIDAMKSPLGYAHGEDSLFTQVGTRLATIMSTSTIIEMVNTALNCHPNSPHITQANIKTFMEIKPPLDLKLSLSRLRTGHQFSECFNVAVDNLRDLDPGDIPQNVQISRMPSLFKIICGQSISTDSAVEIPCKP